MIALFVALALTAPTPIATPMPIDAPAIQAYCKGCGCRGGPGWRIHRSAKCASHKNLAKECDSPPSPARCTKEN